MSKIRKADIFVDAGQRQCITRCEPNELNAQETFDQSAIISVVSVRTQYALSSHG